MRVLPCALVLLAIAAFPVFGSAINTDGTFYEFNFGTAPFLAVGCNNPVTTNCSPTTNPVANVTNTSPWLFTGPATLFILDLGDIGDRFSWTDSIGGGSGTTSDVGNPGTSPCAFDIGCSAINAYSKGSFILGGGDHSIQITLIQNALNTTGGQAVFSVTAIPEPGTIGLLGGGLLALALARRRRNRRG
jgi:hypothetical protein